MWGLKPQTTAAIRPVGFIVKSTYCFLLMEPYRGGHPIETPALAGSLSSAALSALTGKLRQA
jgi:hypothetical protein